MDKTQNTFKVEFTEWLEFVISDDKHSFENWFSPVYDPLLDLKHWLESIAIGVEQTSFTYCPEGRDIRFDVRFAKVSDKNIIGKGSTCLVGNYISLFTIFHPADYFCHFNQTLEEATSLNPPKLVCEDIILFRTQIDRKELVGAFYHTLVDLYNTNKYDPDWENDFWRCTPLSKFRSEIIEKYLTEK